MFRRAIKYTALTTTLGVAGAGAYFVNTCDLPSEAIPSLLVRTRRTAETFGSVFWSYREFFREMRRRNDGVARKMKDLTAEEMGMLNDVHRDCAAKVYDMCRLNGGLYVKAGQILCSTKVGVPQAYVEALSRLVDKADPSDWWEVEETICRSLRIDDLMDKFVLFESEPIGCASLAQVHRAAMVLDDGRTKTVAVKVQHRKLRYEVPWDLFVMRAMAYVTERCVDGVRLSWMMDMVEDGLKQELNFNVEARNATRCKQLLGTSVPALYIPEIITASRDVLVMEFCAGINIAAVASQPEEVFSKKEKQFVAHTMMSAFAEMIFTHGFVHCDPHPGNILYDPTRRRVVLLDHGLYRELSDEFRENHAALWNAMFVRDDDAIHRVSARLGVPDFADLFPLVFTQRVTGQKNRSDMVEVKKRFEKMGILVRVPESERQKKGSSACPHHADVQLQLFRVTDLLHNLPDDFMFVLKTMMTVRAATIDLGVLGITRQRVYASAAHRAHLEFLRQHATASWFELWRVWLTFNAWMWIFTLIWN
eukprot:PhM_4_TR3192/c0_g1_i1/m.8010/K08869/ADCK, ABC1; aarF domain-containing kinase